MDQPIDANGVLRELIETWQAEGAPPERVPLANVRGARTASVWEFLDFMAREPGHPDTVPSEHREIVESLTGQEVGSYGEAAAALLALLERERS
jgi:hypothetical protein